MKIDEQKSMNIIKRIPGCKMKKIEYQGKGNRKLKCMKGMAGERSEHFSENNEGCVNVEESKTF